MEFIRQRKDYVFVRDYIFINLCWWMLRSFICCGLITLVVSVVIVVAPPSIYPPVYPCHFFPQPSSLLLLLLVLVLVLHLVLLLLRQCIPVTSSANHPLYFSFIPSISEQPSHTSFSSKPFYCHAAADQLKDGKGKEEKGQHHSIRAPLQGQISCSSNLWKYKYMQYQPAIISPDNKLLDRGGSTPSHLISDFPSSLSSICSPLYPCHFIPQDPLYFTFFSLLILPSLTRRLIQALWYCPIPSLSFHPKSSSLF